MSKPLLAATLVIAMAGAWTWALWPAPPAVSGGPRVSVPAPPAATVPLVHLDRLASRDVPAFTTGESGNPFRTRTMMAASGGAGRSASAATTTAAPATPTAPPEWPRLALIGLAEAEDGGRLVRTAIVSGPTGVLHARAGDVVERVYRVERIAADGVDVRLVPENRVLRLVLAP